jgi:transposase InsO family protein
MIMDVFSRKIVGWAVHEAENSVYASELIEMTCIVEDVAKDTLVLHSDNGGPMKGSTMLATLQKLRVASSFSRPSVSNDNPYSESLFGTMKYRPSYPEKAFASMEKAIEWVGDFVKWYNTQHFHSGIRFVTPEDRHNGFDVAILQHRHSVYEKARSKHPKRWSKSTRNWNRIEEVSLNPLKEEVKKSTMVEVS